MIVPILIATLLETSARAAIRPGTFDHVLAFGASVTHGTAAKIPGYAWGVRGIEAWGRWRGDYVRAAEVPRRGRPYGPSPVRLLVARHGGTLTDVSRWRTYRAEDLGAAQCGAMLDGHLRNAFAAATLVVGLDAFYWDAIWGRCDADFERTLGRFLAAASAKSVLLGTVPLEDAARVRLDTARTRVPMWWPPEPACVERINALLRRHCRGNCRLVDLHHLVARLNAGERVRFDGRDYGLYDLRPDGVHLSDVGAAYGAWLMDEALLE